MTTLTTLTTPHYCRSKGGVTRTLKLEKKIPCLSMWIICKY